MGLLKGTFDMEAGLCVVMLGLVSLALPIGHLAQLLLNHCVHRLVSIHFEVSNGWRQHKCVDSTGMLESLPFLVLMS